MSRKHFESVATAMGLEMRYGSQDEVTQGAYLLMVAKVGQAFREGNPRFDFDRFLGWVLEVARGERDAEGRKVA